MAEALLAALGWAIAVAFLAHWVIGQARLMLRARRYERWAEEVDLDFKAKMLWRAIGSVGRMEARVAPMGVVLEWVGPKERRLGLVFDDFRSEEAVRMALTVWKPDLERAIAEVGG